MFTYDIEKLWQDSEIFMALTFDIKGVFDIITKKTDNLSLEIKHSTPYYQASSILLN